MYVCRNSFPFTIQSFLQNEIFQDRQETLDDIKYEENHLKKSIKIF